jgi:hypothetical protein
VLTAYFQRGKLRPFNLLGVFKKGDISSVANLVDNLPNRLLRIVRTEHPLQALSQLRRNFRLGRGLA